MPARPMILDDIGLKLNGALDKQFIEIVCCVPSCRKTTSDVFMLRVSGKTDIYGMCKEHKKNFREQHPSSLGSAGKQGAFLFAA